MSAPKWAKGMQRIAPGLYLDADESAHFDAYGVCAAEGIQPTPHNIAMLEAAVLEGFKKIARDCGKPAPVVHDVKDE